MPAEQQHELRTAEAGGPPPSGAIEQLLAGIPALPEDALILIPTRSFVLFPGTVLPVTLGRQRSIAAAQAAIRLNRPIGLVLQRDPATEDPTPDRSASDGHRSECAALCDEPRRSASRYQPRRAALSHPRFSRRLSVSGSAGRADHRTGGEQQGYRGADAASAQPGDRGFAAVAANPGRAGQCGAIGFLGRGVGGFDRQLYGYRRRREAGDPGDRRYRKPARAGLGNAGLPHRGAAPVAADQRTNQRKDRRSPARIPAARADEDDPERTRRRRRRQKPGNRRAVEKDR